MRGQARKSSMKKTTRSITVYLKLFTGAFPERISVQIEPGSRVRGLMEQLKREHFKNLSRENSSMPLQEVAQDDLLLILNGRPIQNLQGYDTPMEDGDVLAVFPVMAGG
jgi:molybdopterin converting factor small subunit